MEGIFTASSNSWAHLYLEQGGEHLKNCTLRSTVVQIGTRYEWRVISGINASSDGPKWSMLDNVLDRARIKAAFELMLLSVLILVLGSRALLAESANSDFKRGESAEAREDYDTAYELYQKAVAKDSKDLIYKTALYRVKVSASAMHLGRGRKLLQGGDEEGALSEFIHAVAIDPVPLADILHPDVDKPGKPQPVGST